MHWHPSVTGTGVVGNKKVTSIGDPWYQRLDQETGVSKVVSHMIAGVEAGTNHKTATSLGSDVHVCRALKREDFDYLDTRSLNQDLLENIFALWFKQ